MNEGEVASPTTPGTPWTPGPPWGPYRERVESALASCADYLGRLQRSPSGELARALEGFVPASEAVTE